MKHISQDEMYVVTSSQIPVLLSIEIGFAQTSVTNIFLAGQKIKDGVKNSFNDLAIGNNQDLKLKELVCETVVYDIQKNTNETSYGFRLSGGQKILRLPKQKCKVSKDGDVVFYTTRIFFI